MKSKLHLVLLLGLIITLAGCTLSRGLTLVPPSEPTPTTPAPTLTPEPPGRQTTQDGLLASLHLAGSAAVRPEVDAGSQARLQLDLQPVRLTVTRRADGSLLSASWQPWTDARPSEMQVCFSLARSCDPAAWEPFREQAGFDLRIDWLGPRQAIATVRARTSTGEVSIFQSSNYQAASTARLSLEILSLVNEKTPLERLPSPVQTALSATRTAFPVSGAVQIEGGACCKAGTAGSTIEIRADFSATSRAGAVTEMRVSTAMGCPRGLSSLDAPWEKFAPVRAFPFRPPINWVGFYVSVQFRDEKGNLSPVYCDDISVEGMPPRTTP